MESINSSSLNWNFSPTSQLSKLMGAFGNLASKFFLRFARVFLMDYPISLSNPPYSQPLPLETMVRSESILT